MIPTILFRASLNEENEMEIASKHFPLVRYRSELNPASLVIPRYSALPFYEELEKDVEIQRSSLINSFKQHQYVADLKNYYLDLKEHTPKTYFSLLEFNETAKPGSYVLKGATNSKKHHWNTHMFAKTKEDVIGIYRNLLDDTMIGEQDIYIREYVPLNKLCDGVNGLPITEEYRFFFYKTNLIAKSFYWGSHPEYNNIVNVNLVPWNWLMNIASVISKHINFYVIDVARTQDGRWTVIELNDGQMSGLSCIDAEQFYKNLANIFDCWCEW